MVSSVVILRFLGAKLVQSHFSKETRKPLDPVKYGIFMRLEALIGKYVTKFPVPSHYYYGQADILMTRAIFRQERALVRYS